MESQDTQEDESVESVTVSNAPSVDAEEESSTATALSEVSLQRVHTPSAVVRASL